MSQKRKPTGNSALQSLTATGKAGFLLVAAAALLSPRRLGSGLIAIGEKLEQVATAAKNGLAAKKKAPKKAEPLAEDTVDFAGWEGEELSPNLEKDDAPTVEEPTAEGPTAEPDSDELTSPDFTANGTLGLIDAKANPERYAELLEMEKRGEIELIRRYRRSYESRLIQSKDPMQEYYSELKNALLRYKGVKSRISWANETFHQGRNHLAKIIVKTSCLYIYLSVDPETLKGTKYQSAADDVSDTKKFGEFPTVIKIKGERKFKYALELIDRICAENLSLPLNKKFTKVDYRRPAKSDEELTEEGLIKLLVAAQEKAKG